MTDGVENKRGGARVRIPPPLVFLAFLLFGVALQYLGLPWRIHIARALTIIAGVVVVGFGVWLIVGAIVLFRASGQDPAPWQPTPSLLFEGPYRFTRNPMYVGMMLIQGGLGIALDNVWIVLFAPLALAAVHFTAVKREEAYLVEKFGEPYRQYLARVRRYL